MVVGNPFTYDARVNKEARSLSKSGYRVVVYGVSSPSSSPQENVGEILVKRPNIKGYSLFRLNVLRAPFDFFSSLLKLIREKADVYHANDMDTLFICFLASRFNRSKLVYDSHELFLEMQEFELSQVWWKKMMGKFLIPVWRTIERLCARRADYIFTVNDSIKHILSNRFRVKKIETLFNCPSFQKVKKGREFHQVFSLPKNARVVLYQGGMMWKRGLKQLVDSIEFLPRDVYMVFMGGGGDRSALIRYASSKPYRERIKFHDPVSLESLLNYTASADLGVVPLLNVSLNNYYGLPNKLFEYIMAGVPVAASDFPEVKKVVVRGKVGDVFNAEDPKSITTAIKRILGDIALREKMRRNALELARTKYNWEIEEKKLIKVYKEL